MKFHWQTVMVYRTIAFELFHLAWLSVLLLLVLGLASVTAQEYETDRIFLKHQNKNHCLLRVQDQIREMKNRRGMSAEHVQHLNRDIWNRKKSGITLSGGQQRRLKQLLQGKTGPKYPSARELLQRKQQQYARMKQNCKNLVSQ